jgi:hypothetical protein
MAHKTSIKSAKVAKKAAAKRVAAKPTLLAGGNPQIAKAEGDAPVQAYIAAMPGWKRDIGRRLDALIVRTGATSISRRSAVRRLGRTRQRVTPRPRRTSGGTGTTTTTPRPRLTRSGSRCPTLEKPPSESATQRRKHDLLH